MARKKPPIGTIAYAAKCAIGALSAVSVSGVTMSFSDICQSILWPTAHQSKLGTAWVNQHPVSILFGFAIKKLTSSECHCDACIKQFSEAYAACKEIVKRHDADVIVHETTTTHHAAA